MASLLSMKFVLLLVLASICNANEDPGLSDVVEAPLVHETVDDLLYDENGKLSTHYLLYPYDNEANCGPEQLGAVYGFETRAVSGLALEAFFPERNANSCEAVCVERGTDRSLVHAVMPHKRWQDSENEEIFQEWFENTCKQVEVCLLQYVSPESPVLIYWIPRDSNGEPDTWVKHLELGYGERHTNCFASYVGDEFVAVVQDGEEDVVIENIRIEHVTTRPIGSIPPYTKPTNLDIEAGIEETLREEWTRHHRVRRTFSELGFKKGRLPDDIFASMGAFYYNNRQNKVLEEWDASTLHVNSWESNVFMMQIPWDLKEVWQTRLLELVEAWAGIPIEQTDLYGMRQYETGSRLLTHVDRQSTHAVSLIVNVAQGNLAEPWVVEVHDHADRLHDVIMEPGDIVYYESAKALHGRNRALAGHGAYYVNLFTHYRPIDDPEWFKKDNPPGVPDPVLDIQGQCHRLEQTNVSSSATVKCDDARLGPYVSPTFFQASQAQDLIDWWRWTSPTSVLPKTPSTSSFTVNSYEIIDGPAGDDDISENDDGADDGADDHVFDDEGSEDHVDGQDHLEGEDDFQEVDEFEEDQGSDEL